MKLISAFAPRGLAIVAVMALGTTSACNRSNASGDVLAEVNGKKITNTDVDKYYNRLTAGVNQKLPEEQSNSIKLNVVRQLIDEEILLQKAEKLGLIATDEEVQSKLNEMKAPYTKEEYERHLKESGLTEEDWKRMFRRQITLEKLINREINSKVTITDADIQQYYNENKAAFNFIEPQYHIAHIVVTPTANPPAKNESGDDAKTEQEARAKLRMLSNRLASGEDFATVARRYSEDPDSAMSGGDLGLMPESALNQTDPNTKEAVLKMRPGQTSEPISVINPQTRQPAFYRIVKLFAKESAGQREINDPRVQQAIRQQLRERREQLLKAAYFEVARDEANIENYLAENIVKTMGK